MKSTQDALEALNSGAITFSEFERRLYTDQKMDLSPKLLKLRENGNWEGFIHMALSYYELMPIAFKYYNEVPDTLKYDFCTRAYTHHGDRIPAVRQAVRGALRYGKPDLPAHLREQSYIEVYRAGEEPIEKAPFRISWTTNKKVALFFFDEWSDAHANHLYKGKIKPQHVIAYTDDRQESEIMQYRHVYDIVELRKTGRGANKWKL